MILWPRVRFFQYRSTFRGVYIDVGIGYQRIELGSSCKGNDPRNRTGCEAVRVEILVTAWTSGVPFIEAPPLFPRIHPLPFHLPKNQSSQVDYSYASLQHPAPPSFVTLFASRIVPGRSPGVWLPGSIRGLDQRTEVWQPTYWQRRAWLGGLMEGRRGWMEGRRRMLSVRGWLGGRPLPKRQVRRLSQWTWLSWLRWWSQSVRCLGW